MREAKNGKKTGAAKPRINSAGYYTFSDFFGGPIGDYAVEFQANGYVSASGWWCKVLDHATYVPSLLVFMQPQSGTDQDLYLLSTDWKIRYGNAVQAPGGPGASYHYSNNPEAIRWDPPSETNAIPANSIQACVNGYQAGNFQLTIGYGS